MSKLTASEIHLIRLISRDSRKDGWTSVGKLVWPYVLKLPAALVDKSESGESRKAKLTIAGKILLEFI